MELYQRLNRPQGVALIAGLVGIGELLLLAILSGLQATPLYRAYLVAFLYWSGLSLGCLGWLLLHNLIGGNWGFAVQRLLNDLGNLLLVALLTWAYLALMQYLVIWSANIPEEVVWYERRIQAGWEWVVLALVVLYLGLPALLLLLRPIKHRLLALVALGALILSLRLLHIYWLVIPAINAAPSFYWPSLLLLLAVGGLWFTLFFWKLKSHALLPFNHPRLQQTLAEHEGVI